MEGFYKYSNFVMIIEVSRLAVQDSLKEYKLARKICL